MKVGLEGRDKRNLRRGLCQLTHRGHVRRVVRRGHRVHFLHRIENRIVDDLNPGHATAVDGFKADRGDLRSTLQATGLRIGQLLDTGVDSHTVVRNRLVRFGA